MVTVTSQNSRKSSPHKMYKNYAPDTPPRIESRSSYSGGMPLQIQNIANLRIEENYEPSEQNGTVFNSTMKSQINTKIPIKISKKAPSREGSENDTHTSGFGHKLPSPSNNSIDIEIRRKSDTFAST
jgi:hypothetical protein